MEPSKLDILIIFLAIMILMGLLQGCCNNPTYLSTQEVIDAENLCFSYGYDAERISSRMNHRVFDVVCIKKN